MSTKKYVIFLQLVSFMDHLVSFNSDIGAKSCNFFEI